MKHYILFAFSALLVLCCNHPEAVDNSDENGGQEQQDTLKPACAPDVWASVSDGDEHFSLKSYDGLRNLIALGVSNEQRSWSGTAWKNDHVATRIDICPFEDSFPGTRVEVSDFVSESGASLSKDNLTIGYLDAVYTETEAYPNITALTYDIISRKQSRDLEKQGSYSIWVDIFVPEATPKGIYRSKVALKSGDTLVAEFDYELEVFDFTLTEPEEWETFLDLWETPFASNRYYSGLSDVEFFQFTTPLRQDTNPFSLYYKHLDPKYQAGLESELELYHKAGGNAISVQVVEGPDNSRLPCATPSLIKWSLNEDGTFSYDYTDMDYWVELNLKHGINRQIDLFYHTGVGWGFVYYDPFVGDVSTRLSDQPGTPRWREVSQHFLNDLVRHLEEKGWFDMAVLYMDERLYEVTKALVEAAEGALNSKGEPLKAGGAVNGDECAPLYDRMYDVSMWENAKSNDFVRIAEERRAKGLQTTLYSCGSGKMSTPNQPAESAFAVYEARKYKMDGVMRWALNKFDEDPLHATVHPTCYPGDCYLIYPDEKDSPEMKAQSSPRFEKLCEGMRVTEKLNLIKKLHPEYADAVDAIVASLKSGNMVAAAASMRTKAGNLSRAVQNGEPAPAL